MKEKRPIFCRDKDLLRDPAIQKICKGSQFSSKIFISDPNDAMNVSIDSSNLAEKLKKLLYMKKQEILQGDFFPTQSNIEAENSIFKDYRTDTVVRTWLKNNTPFKNMTQLKKYHGQVPLKDLVYSFLDSKEAEIQSGKFIPSPNNILFSYKAINSRNPSIKTLLSIISSWLSERPYLPYSNLREYREKLTSYKIPTITLRKGSIYIFPVEVRNLIAKFIFKNMQKFPLISESDLISLIVKGLLSHAPWTNELDLDVLTYISSKLKDKEYNKPLTSLFQDLIQVVKFLLEKHELGEEIIAYRIAQELVEKGLLSYSDETIRDIFMQIFDYLKKEFPSLSLKRFRGNYPTDRIKYTYDYLKMLAAKRGGSLITSFEEYNRLLEDFSPGKAPIVWSCGKKGHEPFISQPQEIERGKWWCEKCARRKVRVQQTKYTYEYLVDLARKNGGRLLTSRDEYNLLFKQGYTPAFMPIKWRCKNNEHDPWISIPSHIDLDNTWCPECARGKYEKLIKWYLNNIFKAYYMQKFKSTPLVSLLKKYNKNNYTKEEIACLNNLINFGHYDAFSFLIINSQEISLAVEYNGPQHYHFPNVFHKTYNDFKANVIRDIAKKKLSIDNNIILIEFPYYISEKMKNPKKIQSYIINKFEEMTGIKLPKITQFDHRSSLDILFFERRI